MKFNFELTNPEPSPSPNALSLTTKPKPKPKPSPSRRPPLLSPPPSSAKEEIEWVPLHRHPAFTPTTATTSGGDASSSPKNLLAWDGSSRLYYWDQHYLHRISVRFGEPEPTSVMAASPSKVLQSDVEIEFTVDNISINRNGTAILLSGSDGLRVMYLYGKPSNKDNTTVCRTVSLGSNIYFDTNSPIRTLQVSWHPYSDTHVGILSSDSVFRLFSLSSDLEKPEQEYYLQPVEPGRSHNTASICPIGFSFGGDHMWDRFAVFILFSEGSIYILCPVVPFGSVYRWECILEIYNDAHTFGLKSSNSIAVRNSSVAIAWLEATFPEITNQETSGTVMALKAQAYVPFDASLSLQGPLRKVCHGEEEDGVLVQGFKYVGRAVGFLYNSISKDTVLVTAWSSGQLQIDALADEIQPVWDIGSPPRLSVDSHEKIHRFAMICESNPDNHSILKLDQPFDQTVWLGHSPPFLRLAIVDLALPKHLDNDIVVSLFADPLAPERIFCLHGGGIDSVVLHFLPFTSQTNGKDENKKAPSVSPVLSMCHDNSHLPSPLSGFVTLADSFGHSWIVGVTSSQECIVLEARGWDACARLDNGVEKFINSDVIQEKGIPDIISNELLSGPKVVHVPQVSPNLQSVTADSIEGRSTLHQYFKLFRENYVEYAHKVWYELKEHGDHLKKIIDDQHVRIDAVQQKLLNIEEKQPKLENRMDSAFEMHKHLEERLHTLKNLPGAHKRPLSRSERDFKSDLDRITGLELDALHSSLETLNARMRKYSQSPQGNASNSPKPKPGRRTNQIPNTQISDLRSAIKKLSLVNSENTQRVKLLESALKSKECTT